MCSRRTTPPPQVLPHAAAAVNPDPDPIFEPDPDPGLHTDHNPFPKSAASTSSVIAIKAASGRADFGCIVVVSSACLVSSCSTFDAGLAIKDFWKVDADTVVFVADPSLGNILNFNIGANIDLQVPPVSFIGMRDSRRAALTGCPLMRWQLISCAERGL